MSRTKSRRGAAIVSSTAWFALGSLLALGGCGGDDDVSAEVSAACSSSCELAPDSACIDLCKGGCSKSHCLEDFDGNPVDFKAVTEVMCAGSTVNWISSPAGGSSKTHACKY